MTFDMLYMLAGALTGFVVGLTGVGGGALMTPILVLFFGVVPTTAVATDLWFAAITKMVGAKVHHSEGHIDWQIVRRLWLGSLPASLIVVFFLNRGGHVEKVSWLSHLIGWVVLITAIGLFLQPVLGRLGKSLRLSQPRQFKTIQPFLTVSAGVLLGVLVSLTSIGAGTLGSLFLIYLYPLRMVPHRLVATDIMHAIPLACVSGLGYLLMGQVNWPMLFNLLVGSIPAIWLGSRLSGKLPARLLQIVLASVLGVIAFKMIETM